MPVCKAVTELISMLVLLHGLCSPISALAMLVARGPLLMVATLFQGGHRLGLEETTRAATSLGALSHEPCPDTSRGHGVAPPS